MIDIDAWMFTAAQMGYNERDFLDMTPRYFAHAMNAYERNNRDAWEQTRSVVVAVIAPNWDVKKHGKLTAEKAMPLPWDVVHLDKRPRRSEHEAAELSARLEERIKAKQAARAAAKQA